MAKKKKEDEEEKVVPKVDETPVDVSFEELMKETDEIIAEGKEFLLTDEILKLQTPEYHRVEEIVNLIKERKYSDAYNKLSQLQTIQAYKKLELLVELSKLV